MEIKTRLKQDITESQFLITTFNNEYEINVYNINTMKNTYLTGRINKNGSIYINIPRRNGGYVGLGYEGEYMDIWEYEIIK